MKKRSTTAKTISLYWHYTQPYKGLFWFGIIGSVFGVLFQEIIPPFIVSRAFAKIQHASGAHQELTFHDLQPYVMGFIVSMLSGLIVWRVQGFAVWQYQIRAQKTIAVTIFDHLQRQGQKFHADRFGGAIVSQTSKFLGAYERIFDELTWNIVPGLTALTAAIVILSIVSFKFALILIAVVIIYIAIMSWRVKHQFPYNRREAEQESLRTAALADAITNIGNIRAFANEDYELHRFTKRADKLLHAYHELSIETFKNDSVSHAMTNSLRMAGFAFGVYAVTTGHGNASVLYLVVAYAGAVMDRLWQFGRIVRNVNRSLGDAAEMTEILQLTPEILDPTESIPARVARGGVRFDNVTFQHEDNQSLFKGLSLRIHPGEKVGLVGPSGGGKTTLTSLLLRFMDIQDGAITIDDQNISKLTLKDLRSRISYVSQEPILFHRSLAENIGYGDLSANMQAIEGAAKMAHADEFVERLEKGYDTLVGERGVKLSGGQRQRVAIARAMLKNAPILVLDEATSALDSESEVLVQDALWKLMEGRTAIVIAHRLSTIQKMDRIIVLEDGKIAEQGTHSELLKTEGTYARLWAHQSGGFIED
ncbi:MAG: ABC transporter ATP-binding protein [Patescibacteria group bacterium]|nr:ABC transporter ATP-binding protein [Patescibacteria group bacterium]